MNVTQMYAEAGRLLGDPNNERWSQSVLLSRFNLAQTHILALTNSVKTKETLTATALNPVVQLDSDVMDVIRVDIQNSSGEWKKLKGYLRDQLDFDVPDWQQLDSGEPLAYWWDGTNQQLNLVPAPDAANAITNGIRVWELQKPADMTSGSDSPFSANAAMIPYHMANVHWTVAQCLLDDGTPEAIQKAIKHRSDNFSRPGLFEVEIKKIWQKFDAPKDIPARILFRPQGGRASQAGFISKGAPLS